MLASLWDRIIGILGSGGDFISRVTLIVVVLFILGMTLRMLILYITGFRRNDGTWL